MLDDIKNSTDLANLKERINNCSDEELAAAMEEEWLHGIIPDSGISDEDLARIKAEIHEQIGTRKQFTLKRVLKWTQIAAAIALPICMVIMGMMYTRFLCCFQSSLRSLFWRRFLEVPPRT